MGEGEPLLYTEAIPDLDGEYTYAVTGDSVDSTAEVSFRIGFIVEDCRLRYYVNGQPVKNRTVGSMRFDENGYYTSGDVRLDRAVTPILRQITEEGMTRLDMFHTAYDWLSGAPNMRRSGSRTRKRTTGRSDLPGAF